MKDTFCRPNRQVYLESGLSFFLKLLFDTLFHFFHMLLISPRNSVIFFEIIRDDRLSWLELYSFNTPWKHEKTMFSGDIERDQWQGYNLVTDYSITLTLSWRRPLSYRNQSIDLPSKSMDWFPYCNGLRHESVNQFARSILTILQSLSH